MNKEIPTIKYFYIDDDLDMRETMKKILSNDFLVTEPIEFENWSKLQDFLNKENFDGLLLDWDLHNQEDIDFDSETIAQQARKMEKDFPIVLCSAQNPDNFFKRDTTALDLFDMAYKKSERNLTEYLLSLAEGYKLLQKIKRSENNESKLDGLFGYNRPFYIDVRATSEIFRLFDQEIAVHELVRFLLREVIEPNGLLIDEFTLAARLAVDTGLDSEGKVVNEAINKAWIQLKEKLVQIKYCGVFEEVHDRWWADGMIDWWEKHISNKRKPKNIPFKERFQLLSDFCEIKNLTSAELLEYAKHNYLWLACVATGKAIDKMDGFLTSSKPNLYPWQEPDYVSIKAALTKENLKKWKNVHPLEEGRLETLKRLYTQPK